MNLEKYLILFLILFQKLNISHRAQFNFFMKYLKDNNLNSTKLKENLFRVTSKLFEGNYEFHFYLNYKNLFLILMWEKFLSDLLRKKYYFSNDNINPKTYGSVMKMILNKSEKIINKVKNKQLSSKRLYSFLMF